MCLSPAICTYCPSLFGTRASQAYIPCLCAVAVQLSPVSSELLKNIRRGQQVQIAGKRAVLAGAVSESLHESALPQRSVGANSTEALA